MSSFKSKMENIKHWPFILWWVITWIFNTNV